MAIFSKKEEEAGNQQSVKRGAGKPAAAFGGILVQPRVSEKASHLVQGNKYVFLVRKEANKILIKKAVEGVYKVRVTQVNVINNKGKARNYGRISGTTSGFKKAVVTLKQGDKIEGATETI
ncbi:MAG: 50S ribosomal protein L23 [Patescibacteria group bacterium]|nr:50S ribosomal protein L23 [Patescibacteria group bacterium]